MQGTIIAITSFVTLINDAIIYIAKHTFDFDIKKYIPLISVVLGMLLGIICYFTPDVNTGETWIEAVFIGISAGSAATGINQIGKQMEKDE